MLRGYSPRCLRTPVYTFYLNPRCRPLRHSPSRAFHASNPDLTIAELIEPVSQTVTWGFQGLHAYTGLPWYLTIPLGASIVRLSWLPFQMFTTYKRKPREEMTHLLSAWRGVFQEMAIIKFPGGKESDAREAEAWVVSQLRDRQKAIRKHTHYLGAWVEPVLAVSFLPVWILCMDCIRHMAGDYRTVTSLFLGTPNTAMSNIASLEPGFDTESVLWVPSLVLGDPLWILPISYGALATFSVWLRVKNSIETRKDLKLVDRFFKTLSYAMLALPSVFTGVIIYCDMSTALVLYLIGTTVTQLVQRPLLAQLFGTARRIPKMNAKVAVLRARK